jgi:hypothetical protein
MTMRTLMAVALLAGFSIAADDDDHTGPHKGPVAEWGDEEYHLEVVADRKTGDVAVYVYGDHKDLHKGKATAIDALSLSISLKTTDPATIVKLEPKPAKDDPKGRSSVFVGKNDAFKTDKKLTGTVAGKIGPKPYSGDFKEK